MLNLIRRAVHEPLAIIGILWPLIMLAPYVPGLPRPSPSGLTWRQETLLALLLCLTLALLLRRMRQSLTVSLSLSRLQLFLVASLLAFIVWSAASMFWAANPHPALHHSLVWGSYLAFFLLVQQTYKRPRLLRAAMTMLAVVMLIISVACIVSFWGAPLSLFRDNGLGEPLAIGVPLFAVLALHLRQRRAAIFCGATAVTAWLAMLQMFERAPFIAAGAALMLLTLLTIVLPKFRPRSFTRAAALLAVLTVVTVLQSVPLPFAPGITKDHPTVISRLQSTSANELNTRARLLFWGTAVEMFRAHPFAGIGANNYDAAFSEARAQFSARHPASPLIEVNEGHLVVRAHNEYLQILAELGAVGLALFLCFCGALIFAAVCALRRAASPVVPGAVCSLLAFAISSGASAVSFRWMGSGLMFFFAAALVARFAQDSAARPTESATDYATPPRTRKFAVAALAFSFIVLCLMSAQAMNVVMNGLAQGSSDPSQVEKRFRSSLFWNPYDAAAHFNYGMWLLYQGRAHDAAPHIRFGVEGGINTSVCYVYLASAETEAGDIAGAQRTLARAVQIYPRSVFLRVRHASVLASLGRIEEAEDEYSKALSFNRVAARGWWQLICFGKEAATAAAKQEPEDIVLPGYLLPEDGVHFVIAENHRRPPRGCSGNPEALSSAGPSAK